jgi:hypothetical protein
MHNERPPPLQGGGVLPTNGQLKEWVTLLLPALHRVRAGNGLPLPKYAFVGLLFDPDIEMDRSTPPILVVKL